MAKQKKKKTTAKDAVRKLPLAAKKINKKATANAVRKPAPNRKGRKPVLVQPPPPPGKRGIEFFRSVSEITPDMMEDLRRLQAEQDAIFDEKMKQAEKSFLAWHSNQMRAEENMRENLRVRGFVFSPSDAVLVDFYLKAKKLGGYIDVCPIEEVDVYGTHPQTLTEKYNSNGGVWHFFTKSRPNENSEQWEFGEKSDVLCNGVKVGVRQELEYGGGGNVGGKYKMIEYQLVDPATETNSEAAAPWYICKLYNGV